MALIIPTTTMMTTTTATATTSTIDRPQTISLTPTTTPSTNTTNTTNTNTTKTKKRARFADEPIDHQPSSLSSFITFNQDDPPLKRLRQNLPEHSLALELSNLSADHSQPLSKTLYLTFINTAFNQRAIQNHERYNQLVAQFDPLLSPTTSPTTTNSHELSVRRIQAWLTSLTSIVAQLDRKHSNLLHKILSLPWAILDDQFVNVYFRFVNGLVSARSEWIQLVLEKIVQGFHYRSIPLELRSDHLPSSVNRKLIYQRLHSLLRSILRLIPTLPSTLWPLLDTYFPKKREHRDGHVCYLSNLLKIGTYCPELNEKIIQLCIDKCLKIDVEIQVEVEEWEDDEGRLEDEIFGKSIEDPFEKSWMDDQEPDSDLEDQEEEGIDFDDLSSDGGVENLDDDPKSHKKLSIKTPSPESIRQVKRLAAKLDGMLRCMFDHLQLISFGVGFKSTTPSESPVEEDPTCSSLAEPLESPPIADPRRQVDREVIFDLLLSNFESSILCTHRTRHIQFIIFWYSSLEPTFADSFLATLVERGLYVTDDHSIPVATKVASVSYIASLISRAKYIDKHVTRHVVSLLCARLELGLNQINSMTINAQVIWYAIAQAIFYIFCFRWQDLLVEDDDEDDHENSEEVDDELNELRIQFSRPKKFNNRWLNSLKVLEKSIMSSLNPLKICAPTVVSQFAKISHETNFVYCYDIMRRNESNNNKSKKKVQEKMAGNIGCWSGSSNSSLTLSEGSSTPDCTKSGAMVLPPRSAPTPFPSSTSSSILSSRAQEEMVKKLLVDSKVEVFFPFDPFKLPLTSVYIQNIYRVWQGSSQLDDSDGSDDA